MLVGAIAATPAAATWGRPFNLSKEGQNASQPRIATDDHGTVFVWVRPVSGHLLVQARFRNTPTGALSSVKDISPAAEDAFNPEVAIDSEGDAVITWARSDGTIQARRRAADGTLSEVQDLSGPGASLPQVGIAAEGDAVITWQRPIGEDTRIQARARAEDGTLGPVQNISAGGSDASDPEVGVDGSGDAVFVWRRQLATATRVQTRARSAVDGSLTGVQNVSGENGSAFEPEVAVDNTGNAVFTWRRSDGTVQRIETRARAFLTGAQTQVQKLSPAGVAGQDAVQPQVAVDVDGDAVFTWRRLDGADSRIQARARTFSSGALSAVQDLSDPGEDAVNPEVAVSRVDADPDAVFTWQRSDGTNLRIQARTRSAAGVLGAVQDVSAAGENGVEPRVGVDQDGKAFVTWQRDIAVDRVAGSKGP
jgi:hypothetical protein